MQAVGADACKGGWVAVVLDGGQVSEIRLAGTLARVVEWYPAASAVGVDMPLGLVDYGWREADRLAAARLGRCRSRLFLVPPRPVWAAATHEQAVRLCRELTEPPAGFSRQAWALKEKLCPANELYLRLHHRLFEVHPEVSFAELNGGKPVAAGKKTWNGQMARRALLAGAGLRLPSTLAEAGAAAPDDVLDAAAAAWTAGRIAAGQASSLPSPPQRTASGLPVAIWS